LVAPLNIAASSFYGMILFDGTENERAPGPSLSIEKRVGFAIFGAMGSPRLKLVSFAGFMRKMYLISNKTKKNRRKPVETEERELTKRAERLKVNCGTVLRTRMNTDDFVL
jgi:hypothetical protein